VMNGRVFVFLLTCLGVRVVRVPCWVLLEGWVVVTAVTGSNGQ
jgi:hypothetical protein